MHPDDAPPHDGDHAAIQLGPGKPSNFVYHEAAGRFVAEEVAVSAPALADAAQLLFIRTPLLALPKGSQRVRLQVALTLMADGMGADCNLVVGYSPDAGAVPMAQLLCENVSLLQAEAVSRHRPPGLLDLDVYVGPKPGHGMLHIQVRGW